MKRLIYFLFLIILARTAASQPTRYGNEWVDYTKTYCKAYVTADGIYRIPYGLLNANIPNLSAVNPANFVMIHNGLPIPIYVYTIGGVIDPNTYIEFFGKKNIGDVDSVLFFQPGYQPHTYYSYYTDTSVYFLTVNSSANNPRYTFVNNDTASIPSLTPEPYFWFDSHFFYPASAGIFSAGRSFIAPPNYVYKGIYDRNEAWGSSRWINYGQAPFAITIPSLSVYTSGPQATVNIDIFTRTWEQHNIVTTLNSNPLQTLTYDNTFGGFDFNLVSQQVAPTSLNASNTITVQETAPSTSTEENLLIYARILYPRLFQFDNAGTFEFNLASLGGERYFGVNNFNDGGTQPLLYDITNGYIIRSTDAPGALPKKFVIPAVPGQRELYLRADNASAYTTIKRLDTVTFQNYTALASQGNYMVISNKALYADSSGHNWVQDYVNYRSRTSGPNVGHLDARLFDIDQLTDQFGYGVKQSPLATRNFVEYAYDHWAKKPEYLFIIGKGIVYYLAREVSTDYNMNLVSPFGEPPSDNLLTCRRGTNRPLLAVGRLAARKGTDVENYLNKIMTYEKQQNTYGDPHQNKEEKLWMKQIMNMAGGSDASEQSIYQGFLSDYAQIATDTSWGANVYTFSKTTAIAIDNTQAALINQHIDSGVSMMTFFGHSAGTAFDIAVDDPETWTNYGKYPLIYSNGCYAGSIFDPPPTSPSYSERFVLTPGRAAIAFIGTYGLSVASGLDDFATFAYFNFCRNNYTQPFAKAIQHTMWDMDSIYGAVDYTMCVADEITLHGDPALTLNQYNLPDYQIDQASVFFTPQIVNASMDSFTVNVAVTNLGRAIKDSMLITLTRSYPDPSNPLGTLIKTYTWKVRTPYYIDTCTIKVPTFPVINQGFGQNQFSVFVESGQRIPEISETNNGQGIQFSLSIQANDIIPIYPYQFAIVPKQNLTVKASTSDPFAKMKTYRLQVDTSALFRHPLAQTTVRQVGGVIHWALPITFTDSTVYYWRVSRDSINDTLSYNWHTSSFIYIKNEYPGWNQSHYFQYGQDNYDNDVYLATDRTFKFVPTVNNIKCTTGWCTAMGSGGPPSFIAEQLGWTYNSVPEWHYSTGGCGYANNRTFGGFTFAVIDTAVGIWQSANNGPCNFGTKFFNWQCTGITTAAGFDFSVIGKHPADACNPADTMSWAHTISAFLDSIPTGDIVLMYAVSQPQWRSIDTGTAAGHALVLKLAAMGATGLLNLCSGQHQPAPYIFWTMKGNPAWGGQVTGHDYTTPLSINSGNGFNYGTLWNKGSYVSPTIGPAGQWGSFHWRWRPKAHPAADIQSVDIVGVQSNGTQVNLLSTTTLDTTLSFINAQTYPNIYLRMNVENDTAHVPSQLYYWRVLYKSEPEAAINPAAYFSVQRDTIGLGDSLNVQIALENVTNMSMDSMRTRYTVRNLQNGAQQSIVIKQDSLRAGDTMILKYKQQILSPNFTGYNQLTIEANPEDALHQPEEYHFNNYAVVNFSTTGNTVNPLLDVTFDSRRIMNGDIVSAKPTINITVKDQNKYLGLIDTSTAVIYVRYPGQTVPTPINYDNNILTFYPATGNLATRNQAEIVFKPTFTLDGAYDLLIKDKNASGTYSSNPNANYEGSQTSGNGVWYNYKITFNVINKSMITNVLNYPNPFSTRTQFVFTLTGSQAPDYMKIQIMTITGKVVKEITKEELGNITIGLNRTDYYWDGRDQYGNKLANGVYFYRVIANIANRQIDHMSSTDYGQFFDNTNIDKYFKNGFGKLVIMR
jgi:hypothetical protein